MTALAETSEFDARHVAVERAWRYFGGLFSAPDLVPDGARRCVALLVDVDDFVVRAGSHEQAWASQQVAAVERLLEEICGRSLPVSIHRIEPDEWVMVLGAADDRTLLRRVGPLAEEIRAAVAALTEVTVTVSFGGVAAPEEVECSLGEALCAHERKLVLGGDRVIDAGEDAHASGATPQLESIEQPLSQRIRQGDRDGAVTLLRGWLMEASALDGLTPELLRRWVAAQMLSALNAAGERRATDGSALWAGILERATLEEFGALGMIHERSYLNLWVERLIGRVVDPPNADAHPILGLVTAYLDEHYEQDLSLVIVARAVGCSPYYISHLFKREMDTTFLTHLTAIRMAHARTMLTTTRLSIAEVANRVGYRTARQFRTVFKRAVGVTPTAYRFSGPRQDVSAQAV